MSFLLLILPFQLYAKTEGLPEAQTETSTSRLQVAVATSSPITEKAIWPVKPNAQMASLKGRGNCVKCMRSAGFHVPMGYTRGAKWIPVPRRDIEEGEVAVAVTYEGWAGHVVLIQRINGKDVQLFECNYYGRNYGDEVPRSLVKGYLSPDPEGIEKLLKAEEPLKQPDLTKLSKV